MILLKLIAIKIKVFVYIIYVNLDHKTSHKGRFLKYSNSVIQNWINKLSIDVWFVTRDNYLKIWNLQINLNIENISFKVVQMKFLAMHITNQKLSFDIFTVENVQNLFMEHDIYLMS